MGASKTSIVSDRFAQSGNISVPYGGALELLQYNNEFLPEEAIAAAGLKVFV